MTTRLDNMTDDGMGQFFGRLAELFDHRKGKDHGAIYLVQKRCT